MSGLIFLNVVWQVSILALVTFGLAIIFGQLKIMNMAHGEFVMIGAYSAVLAQSLSLPYYLQIPLCIVIAVIIAFLMEYLIVRHLYGRIFDSLLATWAVGIVLRECVILLFGRSFQNVKAPLTGTMNVFNIEYPLYRIVIIACIILFFISIYIWYRRSMIGVKLKAMVVNPDLAQYMGINVQLFSRYAFIFGAVITSLAGFLLAPTTRVDPFMGIDYLIRAFFTLVIGGLGSLEGLILGSTFIGGVQSFISSQLDQVTSYMVILMISVIFLWRKPNGIINKN